MAKKPVATQTDTETKTEAEALKDAPVGFQRDTAVGDAPWFAFGEENIVHGTLVGIYEMNTDPPRTYAQVELLSPAPVIVGRGADAEEVEAQKGEIVNVGFTYQLQVWNQKIRPEIEAGATWAVWVKCLKKLKMGSGKSVWQLDVRSKRLTAPTSPVAQAQSSGEDTPF